MLPTRVRAARDPSTEGPARAHRVQGIRFRRTASARLPGDDVLILEFKVVEEVLPIHKASCSLT